MDNSNVGYYNLIGLEWVYADLVSSITLISPGVVRVNLGTGIVWNKIYFTPGAGKFPETNGNDASGVYVDQKLAASCVNDDSSNWEELDELSRRRVILRLTFKEGVRIAGTKERGFLLSVSNEDGNGRYISISSSMRSEERSKWEEV